MEEEESMSFISHLEELRWRIIKALLGVVVMAILVFLYREEIIDLIFIRLKDADFPTFQLIEKWLGEPFGIPPFEDVDISFQNTALAGQFGTSLKMAFIGGFIVAFPWVFFQLWSFIKPGLKQNEIKSVRGITWFVSVLFFMGILFGYYLVAPLTVNFLGNFVMTDNAKNQLIIADYLSTILSTIILTGLLFLLPVVILIFTRLGLINATLLKKYRKHAFVGVLIASAVITPPDVITQIIVSIPIYGLYEFGIWISKREEKRMIKEMTNG